MMPWRCPNTAKQVRAAFACPIGSASASSIVGVACPSILDIMMTQCAPANFLEWVIRSCTFRLLYVFVMIEHESCRLLHVNVTAHPTAQWTGYPEYGAASAQNTCANASCEFYL